MIGKVIGNYKIVEKIGEGGMGAVYRGLDTMLEREVAIKMLKPELASQPEVLERFRSEAVTLARLNHPNIATLYSFMRDGEDYFMVMEFVRGQTIDELIRRFGAMLVERAVPLFCQALDGIDHAHRMGIIHRDIKPANVMLTDSGSIKVMDFGIARVLGSARMTRQGNIVGTIEYMSPEAVRGLEVDARSDVYSLGILLYEMVTGRVPFDSTSEFEMMKMQVEQAPQPPRTFTASIPLEIEQAIMRSLAKKPAARFQTAGELRAMLLGALGKATSGLPLHTTNYAAPATRAIEVPSDADTQRFVSESEAGRSATRVAGSPGDAASAFETQNQETQMVASPPRPAPSGDTASASGSAPTIIVNRATGEAASPPPPAPTIIANKFTGETPQPPPAPTVIASKFTGETVQPPMANTQVYQAASPPPEVVAPAAAPAKGRLNWKHYTAAAALLVVLIGVPLAVVMSRSPKPAPAPSSEEQAAPENTSPPIAPVEGTAPSTNANANEAVTPAVGSLTDAANSNGNANASRSARTKAKGNENSNAPATAETPAEPEQKPAQAEPPPQTPAPAPEAKPAPPQEGDKSAAKPEEKKKKGGIGGFIKKIFGGNDDKKKEENKNKKP
ncbi:MAG TPA: serine/threonine-protein kinase [Blastocatellia bacterium]|nr:serine/threonine-protein kinase [Blastocatellia bacterium]